MNNDNEFVDQPVEQTHLLIEGIMETCSDEMIRLYILLIVNSSLDEAFKVEEIRRNRRRVLVKFNKAYDFEESVARQKKIPQLCGNSVSFQKVLEPNTIRVTNLANSCTKEVLNLYFSNTKISSGGDLKSIKMFTYMNKALVEFQDYRLINNVMSHTHIICEKQVKLEKYWGSIEDEYFLEEDELENQAASVDVKQDLLETSRDKLKRKSMAVLTSLKSFSLAPPSIDKTKLIISNIQENINIQQLEFYINLITQKNEIKEINWSLDFKVELSK